MANSSLAYRSSISVSNIKRSVSSLGKGIKRAQGSAISLSRSISQRNETKRQAISVKAGLFQRRREAVRRRDQEDIVEAGSVFGGIRRTQKVVMNSTKGFLGRILDYVGTLLVGWAVVNLPMIIKMGQVLIGRIQKLTSVLSTFITDTTQFLFGFGQLLDGVARNLISFDFVDSQGRINKAMEQMRNSFTRMEDSIFDAIRILTEPISFDFEEGTQPQEEPPTESGQPSPPGPSGGLPDPKSSEMYRIAAALTTEGRAGQSAVDIMQVVVNRKVSGRYGKTYDSIFTARNQFAGVTDARSGSAFLRIRTLQDAAKWSGQSEATLLGVIRDIQNPSMQAAAAKHVKGALEFRAAPQYYLKNGLVPGEMGSNGRFYNSAWRGSAGDNQFLQQSGKDPMIGSPGSFNLPSAGSQNQPRTTTIPVGTDLTNVIGRGVQYIEISSGFGSRGGNHRGLDIAAPAGTYIALRLDSEVMFAGWQNPNDHKAGYGQVIDLWVPELGVQLRFGHCAGFLVTGGKVKAGRSFATVGSTGKSSGPHIHLEYTKQRNRTSGGSDGDPSPYVPYILLTNKPNYSSFTVPGKGRVTPSLAQVSIDQNKDVRALKGEKKDNVIAVPLPSQQQRSKPAIMPMGESATTIPIDDGLNRFVTQKLLLDLAYT